MTIFRFDDQEAHRLYFAIQSTGICVVCEADANLRCGVCSNCSDDVEGELFRDVQGREWHRFQHRNRPGKHWFVPA